MANFPMSFPMAWNIDNTTYIRNGGATIAIHRDGEILLKGDLKEAAVGLIKFAIDEHVVDNESCIEVTLNGGLCINYEKGITISFIGKYKPAFWDELMFECERIKRLKAFW